MNSITLYIIVVIASNCVDIISVALVLLVVVEYAVIIIIQDPGIMQ